MARWRGQAGLAGFDLEDASAHLLDLRYADDVLVFAKSYDELSALTDALATELAAVGLILNASKTVVLTTEAQAPEHLHTQAGFCFKVIDQSAGHKWLGGVLSASGLHRHTLDLNYHLQAANKAFYANRWLLCDRSVSLQARLRLFASLITPVACFASGHRVVYKDDLRKLDVEFRKLMRQVVGPPGGVDWSQPWHEILHIWNDRVRSIASDAGIRNWSAESLGCYWNLATYAMSLPEHRWLPRVLRWRPTGPRTQGRPAHTWENKLIQYCRWRDVDDWSIAAVDTRTWSSWLDDFVIFVQS